VDHNVLIDCFAQRHFVWTVPPPPPQAEDTWQLGIYFSTFSALFITVVGAPELMAIACERFYAVCSL